MLGLVVLLAAGCTHGPEEQRVVVGQIVRVGESDQALVTIQYERFQRPTGLNAFPDGGKARVYERIARLFLVNAVERTYATLMVQAAPDSLWESFNAGVGGVEADSVFFLHMTGCLRGGECYPQLQNALTLRISMNGTVRTVRGVPATARLPGVMLARRPGEERYVRFSTNGNVLTARFVEDGPFKPIFEVLDDGSLASIGG
jgi:hypothetical protein